MRSPSRSTLASRGRTRSMKVLCTSVDDEGAGGAEDRPLIGWVDDTGADDPAKGPQRGGRAAPHQDRREPGSDGGGLGDADGDPETAPMTASETRSVS